MVDVQRQLDAVTRGVTTGERDGAETRVQTLAQTYPSPIEDVWDAVTTERIGRWFLPISGDLRLGGRYQLEGNAEGEVLECTPPRDGQAHFSATWEFGGGVTWLEVALTVEGESATRVELTHTARVDDVPPGFWEQFGPGATGVGWDGGMLGLALHLSSDVDGPTPAEAAAWGATEEGMAFYRGAADGWGRAHEALGTDAAAAAQAADNTFAFYTGAPQPEG